MEPKRAQAHLAVLCFALALAAVLSPWAAHSSPAPLPEEPAAASAAAGAAGTADPWEALAQARRRLADAGPATARFEQTYVPAGFSSGERETGRLALALPDCLRWDYDEPYPKSFLLCDGVLHYWNAADGTGHRQRIDGRNEPGLDLLLLSVDALKERYQATAETGATGDHLLLHLEPRQELPAIQQATLTLEPATGRVLALEYADQEGNRTRFTLSGYGPLTAPDLFTPPAEIPWEEDRVGGGV